MISYIFNYVVVSFFFSLKRFATSLIMLPTISFLSLKEFLTSLVMLSSALLSILYEKNYLFFLKRKTYYNFLRKCLKILSLG